MGENSDLLFELYTGLPRGGPGGRETTRKAYKMLPEVPANPKILDIGCGPGIQTIELAKLSEGTIIALDIYQPFLDEVMKSAENAGVSKRVKTIKQSMLQMDFEKESFDIIWAESSIFVMGFEKALKAWRVFLKKGGYIGASELVWLLENPPEELKVHWEAEYPGIQFHEDNLRVIEKLNYEFINSFMLSEEDWLNCYNPMEKKLKLMREKYKGDIKATKFLDLSQQEIDFFRKYSKYYGYIFYLMQKVK